MSRRLYTFGLYFYHILIRVASLWDSKARQWVLGRKHWRVKAYDISKNRCDWVWCHCSSLGEYEDSIEVFKNIKLGIPEFRFLLTFYSPSGFAKDISPEVFDEVMYLPKDTPSEVEEFLQCVRPKLILFSRSEIWPNMLHEIRRWAIPTFLIGLRLEGNSGFTRSIARKLFQPCFQTFTTIYCQQNPTKELLELKFSLTNTKVVGNPRIDTVVNSSERKDGYAAIERFINRQFCVVAGSTLSRDEKLLWSSIKELADLRIKWIVVPHEINKMKRPDEVLRPNTVWLSDQRSIHESDTSILIIDQVGHLKSLYALADIAIIGGGFNSIGIHSILEPAAFGVPSLHGPNHRNQSEALDLLRTGLNKTFRTTNELVQIIRGKYQHPPSRNDKQEIRDYMASKAGASTLISDSILNEFRASYDKDGKSSIF